MTSHVTMKLPVCFMVRDDIGVWDMIHRKAVEVDEANGTEPEVVYSLAQAITTILHNDPDWLFREALVGWVVDIEWEELASHDGEISPEQINQTIQSIQKTAQMRTRTEEVQPS